MLLSNQSIYLREAEVALKLLRVEAKQVVCAIPQDSDFTLGQGKFLEIWNWLCDSYVIAAFLKGTFTYDVCNEREGEKLGQ